MKKWQTIKENLTHKDRRFKVYDNEVLSPRGKKFNLLKIDIKPGAHLVGLTSDDKIPLIKQYRYPASDTFLEIPSGGVDIEKESFKEAAIREFKEEVGFIPHDVKFVARYCHSPSLNFPYEIYFSNNLEKSQVALEEEEFGSLVVLLTYDECMEKIKSGQIHDSSTIACLIACREKGFL